MARYIDIDLIMAKIAKLIEHNKDKKATTVLFQLGDDIMDLPTEDVVPRSEVENIFDKYGNYNFPTEPKENFNNTVVTGNKESIDFYCSFTKSKTQSCPIQDEVEKAKQEVAREIFAEVKKKIAEEDNIFEKCASRLVGSDYCNGRSEAIGFILNILAELKRNT